MQTLLPISLNFMRQVERKRQLEGYYLVSQLTRLNKLLYSGQARVNISLNFMREKDVACLKGRLSADLTLECQRCLEPMQTEVATEFCFALLQNKTAIEQLPESIDSDVFEPYIIESEEQSLIDLIEDEVLLSLPMVVLHKTACSKFMSKQPAEIKQALMKVKADEKNPFEQLKALKGELSNS